MHKLSRQQKIENYEELLRFKKEKVQKLEEEITNITRKLEKLLVSRDINNNSPSVSKLSNFETSHYF